MNTSGHGMPYPYHALFAEDVGRIPALLGILLAKRCLCAQCKGNSGSCPNNNYYHSLFAIRCSPKNARAPRNTARPSPFPIRHLPLAARLYPYDKDNVRALYPCHKDMNLVIWPSWHYTRCFKKSLSQGSSR